MDFFENNKDNYNPEELDFKLFAKNLKRNWKLIFLSAFSITTISIVYSIIARPIFKGSFEILVQESKEINNNINLMNKTPLNKGFLSKGLGFNTLKSQESILKSPSVLMPVFNFVQSRNPKNLDYKKWIKKDLKIGFEEDTNILGITYKNNDKKFIIEVLEMISKKYQQYSKSDKERQITNSLKYLKEQQKIYKQKSEASLRKLNVFSIENGLGDIDGFVDLNENNNVSQLLPINSNQLNSLNLQNIPKQIINNNQNKVSMRFQNQFKILEDYEAQYVNLSSRLKPNSKTLKNLKIKIDNLKTSLKRPNQILIKFKALKKEASRNEKFLNSIEEGLIISALEKVKQKESWRLISQPTISKVRVFPKKRQIVFLSFFFSLIFGILLATIKDKISGLIFHFEEIDKNIKCNYLNSIYRNNLDLSAKLLITSLDKKINISELGSIDLTLDKFSRNLNFAKNKKFISLTMGDYKLIDSVNNLVIFISEAEITYKDLSELNKYIDVYKEKIIGWVLVRDA
tara:strand:+ start:2059 stop:3603 length:1545 start_codon:yes stop_codon:yes gene_type:complete